jgi:hypothetical protein
MNPTQLAKKVVDICLSTKLKSDAVNSSSPAPAEKSLPFSLSDTSRWTGYYRNPIDETVRRITVHGGALTYERVPGIASQLTETGKDTFRMLGVPARVEIQFSRSNGEHALNMSVMVDSGKPLEFDFFKPFRLTKDEGSRYAGTYFSEELNVNYSVAALDSQLIVQVRRFDDLPLTPTIRDVFKYQDFRTFTFQRDSEHRIAGFVLSSGRARNIAFSKIDRTAR